LLADFKQAGGAAMEVSLSGQTPDTTRHMTALCLEFQLHASCGSDFHDPAHGWRELGRFAELHPGSPPVWALWH
jgi:predicted metal-dependent phosphoesterase TrpH